LDVELESELISFICNHSTSGSEEQANSIDKELTDFLSKWRELKRQNSREYVRISDSVDYHPRKWWLINQKYFPNLFVIAEKVFNFPTSSASTERSFSNDSFIHSKSRNRLAPERVQKLLYIRSNASHVLPKDASGNYYVDSDYDSDE